MTHMFTGRHIDADISLQHVQMDAFNLVPGATFMIDDDSTSPSTAQVSGFSIWIVIHVDRSIEKERVYVWARRGDELTENPADSVLNRSFDLDYCDTVALIGIVINPTDPDDNNWGNVN